MTFGERSGRLWGRVAAAVVALLGFAPIGWLLGHGELGAYTSALAEWGNGVALAALGGVALALVTRRSAFGGVQRGVDALVRVWTERPAASLATLGVLAFALYGIVAWRVFGARPLIIDEVAQLEHARILATGRLWAPVPPHPELTSIYQMVDLGGKLYSQFPAGGPALIALGILFGAPWMAGPLCGAVAVVAFGAMTRAFEPRAGVSLAATLLFALSPFVAFLSGTMMNHVPTLALLLVAAACLVHAMASTSPRPGLALGAGLAFGLAASVRPADAAAFAIPSAVWLLARAAREPGRWRDVIASGIGVCLPLAVLLWINRETTGHPLLFGYEALWGKAHSPGFHADPSGVVHTPAAGLTLLAHYAQLMQAHLFEGPLPALLPVVAALLLVRRVDAADRWLLACSLALAGLYAAYWFDGNYLGPRFLLPLAPLLVLWTARLPVAVRERFPNPMAYRGTLFAFATAGAMSLAVGVPARTKSYHNYAAVNGWSVDSAAVAGGVRNALVLVRESWGSQLVARLWALGVSRPDAAWLFRRIDTCRLDEALGTLEATNDRGAAAAERLRALTADSARVVASPFSPNTQERWLYGTMYSAGCQARVREDLRGTTQMFRALASNEANNVYVRALGDRDRFALEAYGERPVYLLAPADSSSALPLRFFPVDRDSVLAPR